MAMSKWKDIARLGDKAEKQRETTFEAAMIAALGKEKKTTQPVSPAVGPTPPVPQQANSLASGAIAITVTENGKTTTYTDLNAVPLAFRQKIVVAWLSKPSL